MLKILLNHVIATMRKFLKTGILVIFILSLLGCPPQPEIEKTEALIPLPERKIPFVSDDMPIDSLKAAIERSMEYLVRVPKEKAFSFGCRKFSAEYLVESLHIFLCLLNKINDPQAFNRRVKEYFDFYKSTGDDGRGKITYTGYYEPILDGSLVRTEEYRYPIYRKPDDLITIDLSLFHPRFSGKKIVARYDNRKIVPYFNREEIDCKYKLANKGLEIAWISDPIDSFLLQIQGSGRIRLQDIRFLNVHYVASNGRPYRSIGKLMIDEGIISREDVSIPAIRNYLKNQPQEMERIFNHNESYVFFEVVDRGPLGSIEVPLTPGRSIATDPCFFPKGALAFISTEKPIIDASGKVIRWEEFSRLVMNQDAGGAIKGPGRADLFWGSGRYAELAAGYMKQPGKLYFLVKKGYKYYGEIRG